MRENEQIVMFSAHMATVCAIISFSSLYVLDFHLKKKVSCACQDNYFKYLCTS